MRHFFFLILFPFVITAQTKSNLTMDSINDDLVTFLIEKGDINTRFASDFKNNKNKIHVFGLINNYSKNELIDGMYSFSAPISHTRAYYLIIDDKQFTILDLSNKDGCNLALKNTLDFCEKRNYCTNIVKQYISGIIYMYYKNKNPLKIINVDCKKHMKNHKDLP